MKEKGEKKRDKEKKVKRSKRKKIKIKWLRKKDRWKRKSQIYLNYMKWILFLERKLTKHIYIL